MMGSRTRRVGLVFLGLLVMSLALALWLSKQFHVASMAVTLMGVVLTAPGTVLAWFAYRGDRDEAASDLDAKAKILTAAVLASETDQVQQLLGLGGHRIDLTFRYSPEPANNAAGAESQGRLSDVLSYYQQLQPTRLVITGEPGAGKTLLALHLLLAILADPDRTDTDPVPVRLSLTGWDTVQSLHRWIAEQVSERFRARGITPADARALADHHRILPIMDGLDEMDPDGTLVGRRRATRVLHQLNAYQNALGSAPVVLTCRTAQYADLAAVDVRLREAARVQIDPVDHSQANGYLTARTTNPQRWEPVRSTLVTDPDGILAHSLDTPWRLNLAVTVYEQRHPDTLAYLRDPADLCTLSSAGDVRDHLLGRYLAAAASQHPDRPGRYTPQQTHQWLTALASHLATTGGSGTDLVLHQLWPMAGPKRVRTADTLLAAFIFLAFAALLLNEVPFTFSVRWLAAAALPGLAGVSAPWRASSASVPVPRASQLQRLRVPAQRRQLGRTMVFGPTGVLISALTGALVFGLAGALMGGLADTVRFGLTGAFSWGLAGTVTSGLMLGLTDSAASTASRNSIARPCPCR